MDEKTKGGMQNLRRNLLLAEKNLKLSLDQKDFSRAEIVNHLLSLVQKTHDLPQEGNVCFDALDGLSTMSVAVAFALHPVTDEISDRFSKVMRPSDDTLSQWFRDGSAEYRAKMTSCEELIGSPTTSRALPDRILP